MNFELGGINIPIAAGLEYTQTYELVGGSVVHRMQSGRAIKQSHYRKLKTTLSGQGWVPAGLDGLDFTIPLLLKCALPRSLASQNAQISIPSARRKDPGFEPKGFELVGGKLIEAPLNIKGNLAIIEPNSKASAYHIHYYPEILVFAEPPQIQGNMTSVDFSWSLTCEEV